MKVVFGSVVYCMAKKYLDNFLKSIDNQSSQDFSVLLVDDDIEIRELKKVLSRYSIDMDIVHIQDKTPVQLRIELLRIAKLKQTDLLIMGDSDDYFSNTRVEDTVKTFALNPESAFFYNELTDARGKTLMPCIPEHVYNFKEIGEYNFLGLSNTAFNMSKITYEFIDSLEEYHGKIFDWYLFSRLLLEGLCGKRVDGCSTIYRLHNNNIAGMPEVNESNICYELGVKQRHYESLRKYHPYYEKKYTQYLRKEMYECQKSLDYSFWWNLLRADD